MASGSYAPQQIGACFTGFFPYGVLCKCPFAAHPVPPIAAEVTGAGVELGLGRVCLVVVYKRTCTWREECPSAFCWL